MAQLTEEVGEVAQFESSQGDIMGNKVKKESDKAKDLGRRVSRCALGAILCLANQTGVDLQAAFDQKLDLKNQARSRPSSPKSKIKISCLCSLSLAHASKRNSGKTHHNRFKK